MAVPFSNTKLRVPRGFQNLLEGLAREVLRNQPDNIYAFAAIYFDNLLKMREQQGIDPAEIGARHEDRYYNNKAFQSGNVGDVSDPQQQEAAVKIQSAVRGHQSRESSRPDPEATKPSQEEAAVTIQAAYRGYEARKRVHALKEGEAEPATEGGTQEPAAAPEQEEDVDIDLDDPEVEKAAIKIQSSFKGFKTRKEMSAKKSDSSPTAEGTEPAEPSQQEAADDAEPPKPAEETSQAEQPPADATSTTEAPGEAPADAPAEEEVDIDLEDPEVEKAAIKIQAGFKGMMVRKGKKEAKEEETPAEEAAQAAEGDAKAEEPSAEATGDAEVPAPEETKKEEEEEVDIDLSDPQVQDAAVKIQAGFKGMMVRKQMKDGKSEAGSEEAPAEGDAPQEEAAEPAATEDAPQEGESAPAADGEAPAEADAGQAEEAPKAEGDAPEAEASQQEEAATQGEATPAEGEAPAEDAPQTEQEAPKEEEAAPAEGETAPAEETEQAEAPAPAPAEPTSTTSIQDKDSTPPPSQVTSQGDSTAAVENVVERDIEIEADTVKGNTEESKDGEIQATDALQEVQSANEIAVTEGLDGEQGGEGTGPEAGSEDQAAKDQNTRSSKQSVVEQPETKETADVAEVAKAEESIETENVDGVDQAAKDENTRSSKQSVAAEPEARESGEMEETAQAEKDIEIAGKMDEEQGGQVDIGKEAENVTEVNSAEQLKDGQEVDGNAVMPDSGDQGQPDNEDQVIGEAAAEVPTASQEEQDVAQDKQTAVSDINHGCDESNTAVVPSEDKKEEDDETVPSQEESDPTEDKNEESKDNTKMEEEQIDSAVITDEAKQAEESSADKEGGIGDTHVAGAEETATAEEVQATKEVQDVEQEGMVPDETQSQTSEVLEASKSDLEAKEEVTVSIEQSQDEVLSGDAKKDLVDDNEGRDSGLGFEVDSLPESTVQASQDGQTEQDDKPGTLDDLGNKEEQATISQGDQSENVEENQPDDKPNQDANEQSQDATLEEAQNANDVEGQVELEAQEAKAEEEASKAAEPSAEKPSGQVVDDQSQETSDVHGTQDDQSKGEEIASSEESRDGGGEEEGVGEQEGKNLA